MQGHGREGRIQTQALCVTKDCLPAESEGHFEQNTRVILQLKVKESLLSTYYARDAFNTILYLMTSRVLSSPF